MAIQIGTEMLPLMKKLIDIIDKEKAMTRQTAIEFLVMRHAAAMGNKEDAHKVINGICKHAKQMLPSGKSYGIGQRQF